MDRTSPPISERQRARSTATALCFHLAARINNDLICWSLPLHEKIRWMVDGMLLTASPGLERVAPALESSLISGGENNIL